MPYSDALARSPGMSLQSSKEHKVNGMTTRAVCSPSPHPSPSRERGGLCGYYFVGIPQPLVEGPACTVRYPLFSCLRMRIKPRHHRRQFC